MNNSSFRAGCVALALLGIVCGQPATGAVLTDNQQPFNTKSTSLPAEKNPGSQTPDALDGGYFKLQQESCLPLGPAQQTVMRIIGASRQLSSADAATLSFSWRQIQHYRAEAGSVRNPQQCYYFLL